MEELELLKGLTGYAEPGVLTALMGGSGAGKTTLMVRHTSTSAWVYVLATLSAPSRGSHTHPTASLYLAARSPALCLCSCCVLTGRGCRPQDHRHHQGCVCCTAGLMGGEGGVLGVGPLQATLHYCTCVKGAGLLQAKPLFLPAE